MSKLFTADMLQKILADAMQIFGAYGYSMEYPMQRYWRDGVHASVGGGTSEIMKMVIGSSLR